MHQTRTFEPQGLDLLRRNGSMFRYAVFAFVDQSLPPTLVFRFVGFEAFASMPIGLSLLAWHFKWIGIENAGRQPSDEVKRSAETSKSK
jgi:hypothetical protein